MWIMNRLRSFRFAFRGLFILLKEQPNARIHLVAATGVMAGGILFGLSSVEWLFVTFAIGFVFSTELLNSALEALVDKVSPGEDPVAGKIKDLAAGAVLVAAISAAVIGGIVFFPKIF